MRPASRACALCAVGLAPLLATALACAGGSSSAAAPRPASPPLPPPCAPPAQATASAAQPAPRAELRSWRSGGARAQIERFVAEVTDLTSPTFAAPADRIAAFDHDGTLWSEQPHSFQTIFAVDFVLQELGRSEEDAGLAWSSRPWAKKLTEEGLAALPGLSDEERLELLAASQAGATTEEFAVRVRSWLELTLHPRFERRYTELVYAPMLELLSFLRQNGFRTYIVCGAEAAFMRVFANVVYGVPPDQVIGSSLTMEYEVAQGSARLRFGETLDSWNDGAKKPFNIQRQIGKRPILTIGNSDGDREMLEFGTLGRPGTLGLLIHHDDAAREWAYDRSSQVGRLDHALDQAQAAGWLIVSMQQDFERIYPFEAPVR